ncbi:PE38 [Samia ricini nucleopolyhedrovirus]|nr:PE38 [Philosamia cynthia ricini nucleopolyhedrovirus virus]BBD51070.1 PE38 [Samia ricini nucleopolyhedrovirus]BBD51219.1 PE38 [Samia ricini nucleopolyhedrovirus]BBD51371.1 PE38 [Samia ricini nucleopolyhedrovirus]
MSSRYSPYNSIRRRQERHRYNQQQALLMETFKKKPVESLFVTCAVCLDTYTTNSNTLIDFLMPTDCTHVFCYKCVLNLYSNAMNVPRATVACPMCNIDVTTWKSFFPNTVVSCKFVKRTADRVPAMQQFNEALKIIKNRHTVNIDEDASFNLETQLAEAKRETQRVQEAAERETQRVQEASRRHIRERDIAYASSCEQVASLQARLVEMQAQLDAAQEENRRLTAAAAPAVAFTTIDVDFDENASQSTGPHERFRSLVYSTVADLMIEARIKNLQDLVFAADADRMSCHVDIDVSFGSNRQ